MPTSLKLRTISMMVITQAPIMPSRQTTDSAAPRVPKVERRKISILDRQQSLELIRALDGHWIQPVVIIALTTGMRQGEIVALKWSDVDFEKKTLRIERSMSLTKAEGLKLKSPKTEAGKRTISLSQLSVDALRRVSAKQSEKRLRLRLVKSNDSMVFDRLLHATDDGFKDIQEMYITGNFSTLTSFMVTCLRNSIDF